ncbi:MAG: DnaJ domain-containing protein, partial [Planctomycetota bacterium]|nr:DnaJ domain-containing protein [Planctomycetota bacterium]
MLSYDPNHDAYVLLGADPGATQEEIEAAFRKAARTWHPDKSPAPDAADRFRELQAAARILRDPHQRAEYDRLRALRLGTVAQPKKKPP